MEPKKLKVVVIDKDTLRLEEDGNKGDFIDLRELTEIDTSSIEKAISNNTDRVYAKKLEEQEKVLDAKHQKELADLQHQIDSLSKEKENALSKQESELKETYTKQISDLEKKLALADQNKEAEVAKTEFDYKSKLQALNEEKEKAIAAKENEWKDTYNKKVSDLEKQIALANQSKEAEVAKKEQEVNAKYVEEFASLKEQIKTFESEKERIQREADSDKKIALAELEKTKDSDYQKLQNQQLLDKNTYESKIKDLENQIKTNDLLAKNELDKKLSEAKETYTASLTEKENEISNLQRERNLRSVKVQGENLERWCNNEVLSYMQNGLKNCTWEKDNLVVKEEGENKGSKADFIFKVYSDETHSDETPLASVCMDMKSENPDSTNKKKNSDYYKQLDINRDKKKCKYAVLVSELEMEDANDIPIFKVNEYPDMYVVRPNYLMTFLNMIVSLTMRYADLIKEKSEEQEKFKSRQEIEANFEEIKNRYLDKPLETLKSKLEDISKNNEAIRKANLNIEQAIADITSRYIHQIEDKLERFGLALEKDVKKIEKIQ
ncbi:MAG: DUF2130 domain-containing protein [Eubacteriales bacterium]|nr:DUF2130 domain-containing protein [Eubacteriales bacterium]